MKRFGIFLVAIFVVIFLGSNNVSAQPRWVADVQVKSPTITQTERNLTLDVEIFNLYDDGARETTVEVLLPLDVSVTSASTNCTASDSAVSEGWQGVVTCDLGNLGVRESRNLQIVTSLPPSDVSKTFGIFAWSISPDPDVSNNYVEVTEP